MQNTLYYGDNLDVLRRHVDDESVDLIYLDPPFNSDQNYNVLFQEHDGAGAASRFKLSRILGIGIKSLLRSMKK